MAVLLLQNMSQHTALESLIKLLIYNITYDVQEKTRTMIQMKDIKQKKKEKLTTYS